jgi:glyoxalase/bleomycin resistance protein/dioxygenase superfamily protein
MSDTDTIVLERIDHGVLPSNDLGRAFQFWSSFMGARLGFHANLNAHGLKESLFVLDPDGNTVELCIRKQPADIAPQPGPIALRRISHVRIEANPANG